MLSIFIRFSCIGWRKISFYFNVSYEIKDKTIEFDGNGDVQRAEFVVRAHMLGGRFSDGWGSCERREKRFLKPNHDIPSTAETRAKNKACQSRTCNLREAVIIGSIIQKVSIPPLHSRSRDWVLLYLLLMSAFNCTYHLFKCIYMYTTFFSTSFTIVVCCLVAYGACKWFFLVFG